MDEASRCRHLWQPIASAHELWSVCVKCGEETERTTHWEITLRGIRDDFARMDRTADDG